jgi:hypothetical protein
MVASKPDKIALQRQFRAQGVKGMAMPESDR